MELYEQIQKDREAGLSDREIQEKYNLERSVPHNLNLVRFGLVDGQFFGRYKYKNLWWHLDGAPVGYGDLRDEDISRIQNLLVGGEEFVGWNEHHKSEWQQTNSPMVRITREKIMHRKEIVDTEGR